ncbi:MAG: NADH-quinone oxidoreductase subunit NuoG [Sulfurimicrobium sp.]|jgi:NADH-quinone oxidoreductase subunit G|nr:NADH-quinone oxidoreductase subunit NuoG [Sulfurimicrobium sp.]MDP1705537.1 NADH-quinone oxidoreductase subunit NuoG [Sulfurimicrobium sp.]MDP2198595.1 NADH-quinone oxidoreductase subunit NuoG [Sulfurimicrobium sp.]MDP2962190.1 NADH-quinone oxidoreductase subunit NuoG [Sulfurimicrobium sp.]MDZ7654422.1 NADH-quinone oxidoreductase subunit NuoG [Sulfurimicrobium sp.]
MAHIEIDGKQIEVKDGSTVMDAARQAGIHIPHFCYHKKLSIAANCRMCLVQVEKAPKPLPACATPVTDGMKVLTRSESAIRAQKGVMEFLLINHPLDCPICDQGGECQLQDLAVGFGGVASRYEEEKRVVANKELGPLISTDMTRCIHCTRCVRFGQEISGVMELGQAGRGEHSEIMPFVERTVDSELSGNMIDLCPVGALTSKPFRYTARAWELTRRASVSPHDSLGSNLAVHVKSNRVMRVVPRENESINECWLSDKDRYSYEALNSEQRLTQPMIKRHGEWQECDWQTALEYVANGLKRIRDDHGADQIGALASPHSTLEELYLVQKLVRGLGSGNVDHRTRQSDFSADGATRGAPWLGQSIAAVQELDCILVVGSNLRKDHPLLAHRLRQAVKAGADLNLLNPLDDDLLCRVANKIIVSPAEMQNALAQVLKALVDIKQATVPVNVANHTASESAYAIATSLASGNKTSVLLGNIALHHPCYSEVHALAQEIARISGATLGVMGEAANSVGAHIAGMVPFSGPLGKPATSGMNASEMLRSPRLAYLLLNTEIELDCHDPQLASKAVENAELVVAMSAYRHQAMNYADVMLPIAPFAETSGTFVNTEGRAQSFNAVVKPFSESRPAWKVLRVLGNMFNLHGFDYNSSEDVRAALFDSGSESLQAACNNQLQELGNITLTPAGNGVQRIGDVPIYQADALVRRAGSLQRTADGAAPEVTMNGVLLAQLQLENGAMAVVRQGEGHTLMRVRRDDKLPSGCARVPAAHPLTAGLGSMFGEIVVEKA